MKAKSKDQKSLELLYEQVVEGEEFSLLKEEEEYFALMAKDVTEEIYKSLKRYKDFPHGQSLKDIGGAWPGKKEDFIDKNFPKEVANACYSVYYLFSVINVVNSLVSTKHVYEPEEREYFEFKQPDNYIDKVLKTVDYKDKKKFEQTLKEWFVRTLAFFKDYHAEDKSFTDWFAWRKEQLKFQDLRKKLPELEGLI